MKVLITSGGTTEPIDEVRGISNFATGSLGKLAAEKFLQAGHEVFLLAGLQAILPENDALLTHIPIEGTKDLYQQMEKLVPKMDVVIHSMAVSDYRPVYMIGLENFSGSLSVDELLDYRPEQVGKISSKSDHQIMLLEKTPKIISYIKKWNPKALLFGFKLLVGVENSELLHVAREKLLTTGADFILANDLKNIEGQKHKALLVSKNEVTALDTKSEIADSLLKISEELKND
ncbi:phosphopantothenate--cysteine ligase [Lactococcus cremoris]|uniref:phosphopantothenate--cysteine ligase n=1 Tax=Lactococcus lactis subsp. cremoris TaxID=1359 RepID=UPI002871315A|nr:phosphopantothenate--cysteine ligase [Lactococcus cremoris]MDR9868532.1 phosphopantothenate--cysteine ligase [Lactococcus cremoris]